MDCPVTFDIIAFYPINLLIFLLVYCGPVGIGPKSGRNHIAYRCCDQGRKAYRQAPHAARRIDIGRLVFIGETWTKTNMAPLRGWGTRGKRLIARVPHGHRKTLTFLAALRAVAITAPCVFDGPINGEGFLLHVQQILVPTPKPGDLVIMDNLGSHKARIIRRAIKAAGAKLIFLPPHSPDLNPIEQAFARLKHHLRNAREQTDEATWRRIGSIPKSVSATECRNDFLNAGYGSV